MPNKICVISFDHWNYDKHIVRTLSNMGVDSFHIKIGNFKYKNKIARIKNSLYKIFLGKNPKLKKRQDYIINELQKRGVQDQILVINPELIDLEYHLLIKKHCKRYVAYLYDSVLRCPVNHLLDGIFDEVFSFDKNDIATYGFSPITNYLYFDATKSPVTAVQNYIYIGSIDNRLNYLQNFAELLEKQNQTFAFYAIGKKAMVYKLKQIFLQKYRCIIFKRKRFSQPESLQKYKESAVIVDLVRENQLGLSFRIFEAMGLQKNVLTNNKTITSYDIFESGKIIYADNFLEVHNFNFDDKNYSNQLINKYHINQWVQTVFKLG